MLAGETGAQRAGAEDRGPRRYGRLYGMNSWCFPEGQARRYRDAREFGGADATRLAVLEPQPAYVRLSFAYRCTRGATAEHEVRPRSRGRRLVRAQRA